MSTCYQLTSATQSPKLDESSLVGVKNGALRGGLSGEIERRTQISFCCDVQVASSTVATGASGWQLIRLRLNFGRDFDI
ncbi:hypothetical protein PM082_004932 [Marasmius tenuissimus]|nr:hypothetical protein PM082_004932 [Marasmius tenuissimus]